ncbi:hypothetical protein BDZ88DRAFT_413276 [Geranomyces variabilis]|nr:hypothetical protein BDZ88DRAFT_413276 [Geranomyces variabilis]KAJ3134842.1 Transcriptional regulator of nonfermentable carbon utilization [Geranomyces variabilis]
MSGHSQRQPYYNANNISNTSSANLSSGSGSSSTSRARKKKASRACGHCQKAHLTCDDMRPCSRCVKRNLASTCCDGARKKAKYLQDVDEDAIGLSPPANATSSNSGGAAVPPLQPPPGTPDGGDTDAATPGLAAVAAAPLVVAPDAGGASAGANATSAALLHQTDSSSTHAPSAAPAPPPPLLSSISPSSALTADPSSAAPAAAIAFPLAPNFDFGSEAVNLEYSFLSNMLGAPPIADHHVTGVHPNALHRPLDRANGGSSAAYGMDAGAMGLTAAAQHPSMVGGGHPHAHRHHPQQAHQQHSPATVAAAAAAASSLSSSSAEPRSAVPPAAAVYLSVSRPYDYREGFHSLVRHVKTTMEKPDVMRICRALAQFRPSFMAQIMNLSEEDLVFMEKCFQRTILEFDKLIGFSGTPTAVWRRTGEIALVGKEFSILTQWPRERLLGHKTYIYELMDNAGAVDYWEKFSLIAFDNSQQSVMTTCTLVSPDGRPVPCAFCFTIKRDIFDVPLAIVGNFLPLFRPV